MHLKLVEGDAPPKRRHTARPKHLARSQVKGLSSKIGPSERKVPWTSVTYEVRYRKRDYRITWRHWEVEVLCLDSAKSRLWRLRDVPRPCVTYTLQYVRKFAEGKA